MHASKQLEQIPRQYVLNVAFIQFLMVTCCSYFSCLLLPHNNNIKTTTTT